MEKREDVKRASKASPQLIAWSLSFVPAEQNLETIGYFSARYTRKKKIEGSESSRTVELSDNRRIEIIPSAKYGFPNAEDLDFYRAFLKICDERAEWVKVENDGRTAYHPQLPSPIGFSSRELISKAGRHKSHRELLAVRDWVERLSSTLIRGEMFDAKAKRFDVRIGFEPLFKQFVHVGRQMNDGTRAAQNYVWLAQWFIDNYFYLYARPFDLTFHNGLKHAISKTLYPVLDNGWFASNGAPYTKRYTDLCKLLDIKAHRQLSRVRHQLDSSNEELIRAHFVAKYNFPLNASGEWSGNIRWWPGGKWLRDQEHRHLKRAGTARAVDTVSQEISCLAICENEALPQLPLPLPSRRRVVEESPTEGRVRAFYRQLGQDRPSREQVQSGVSVIESLVSEQAYSWEEIDFATAWMLDNIQERFSGKIQSLGLIKHVIGEAIKVKMQRDRQTSREQTRKAGERQQDEHSARRKLAEKVLEGLSLSEHEKLRAEVIEALIEQGVKPEFLLEGLVRSEMVRALES